MPSTFRLHLLGNPAIVDRDARALAGLPKKAFIIAAVTVRAARRTRAKAELAELLWPDLSVAQRGNNLRQLLFRVRQFEVANGLVLFESNEHALQVRADVDCDLTDFDTLADSGGLEIDRLLAVYGGTLLDGFSTTSHALGQWLNDHRLQLEDQFVELILAAIEGMPSEGRKAALGRAIKVAPTAIAPRKALMRQLIADGLMQEARSQYRELQHIGGHGIIAAPAELMAEVAPAPRKLVSYPAVPLAQDGRDRAGVPHLALLPPSGAQGLGNGGQLAESLIDEVTVALTRLRSVSVLAAHTARKVASGEDEQGIGLSRADFILRTKVRAGGPRGLAEKPYLTLLLERAASGDVVWADSMALDADMGPMQFVAIATGVAMTLVDQVERATFRAFQVPADAGAYGYYLVGQKALQVLDLPSTRRARASFKAALSLSPHFAPAYTGFAQSMIYEWVMRGQGDNELVAQARRAAERARDIDPLFGSAYQMLGRASLFEGDFSASLAHFEQAEALNPHHADLLCDLADTLMHSSFAQRANDKIELALELNPLAPDAYWWASAGIKFFVGEYEHALTHLRKVKNSEPVLRLKAACAAMAGQHELAKLARDRFLAIDPGFKLDDWIGVLPVRNPSHRRQYRQALQKAGFK